MPSWQVATGDNGSSEAFDRSRLTRLDALARLPHHAPYSDNSLCQLFHVGRVGGEVMVAEIGLEFVEGEMFLDDFGSQNHGHLARFNSHRMIRIADGAADSFLEKRDRSEIGLL